MSAQRRPLPGDRWHFQHGPIDLVIGAEGHVSAVAAAHEAAWARFEEVLAELVSELGRLRQALDEADDQCRFKGVIARRMWAACFPFRSTWITPMASVAGAIAEEMIASYRHPGIARAWVNNGGDIALHLTQGTSVRIGLYADLATFDDAAAAQAVDPTGSSGALGTDGRFDVSFAMPVRGVATSGWRGRSFSLGIADSVTVLADTASEADAAATVIANAVNVEHPSIVRAPAFDMKEDSDLGSLLVTTDVPRLAPMLAGRALDAGRRVAERLQVDGLIRGAVLVCQGQAVAVGSVLA